LSLRQYANSPQQAKIAELAEANPHWTSTQIAKELGLYRGTVSKAISRMRLRQARKDPSVHSDEAPPGYALRGVSTQRRDPQGNVQWVKTERVRGSQDPHLILNTFKDAIAGILPVAAVSAPRDLCDDLLTVYPLGDPHLGLIASALITGTEYDLDTCIADLTCAMDELVDSAPVGTRALIINSGDYFHADDLSGKTARSGHKLDADSRWHHVLRAGIETMIRLIQRALEKHSHVIVDNRPGNHDDMSAAFLQLCLAAYFKDEPRVTIVQCVQPVWHYVHGTVLIASAHGHAPKAEDMPAILAADFPEDWGRTKTRHVYVGHVHHQTVREYRGCTVESLRVHGAKDAWTHSMGYRAKRTVIMDVWHKDKGHRTRHTVALS
jgi:hypothetical protein